jgi:uncharacterized membrane protein
MKVSLKVLVVAVLLALAAGFAGGWSWRRHSHPTAAERFDEASKSLKKGLFGE